jgi:hypothetical protein
VLDRAVVVQASNAVAGIGLGDPASDRPHWMFVKVPESKRVKNRVHVDFISDNVDRGVKRLLSLGATHVADIDEDGNRWTTLADPEGNESENIAGNGSD